jgi:predicted small lipoprotein YifL
MMTRPRVALALLLAVLISGCGQRGDLYFPQQEREAVVTIPAETPAPAEEDETTDTQQGTTTTPDAGTGGQ